MRQFTAYGQAYIQLRTVTPKIIADLMAVMGSYPDGRIRGINVVGSNGLIYFRLCQHDNGYIHGRS